MISSGTVNQQAKTVTSAIKSCNDKITGLSGSWEGSSYDNLVSKVGEFASSYKSTIEEQMTAFGEACDLYKEYEAEKKLLEQYKEDLAAEERAYNRAKSKGGVNVYLGGYLRDIRSLERSIASSEEKMKDLKKQIEAKLSSISAKLDKGSTPQKVSVNGVVTDVDMGQFTNSKSMVLANLSDDLIVSGESGYVFPIAKGIAAPVTSSVGPRDQPTAGASTNHKGTDIGIATGTKIHSLSSGTVVNTGRESAGGYGNWVQIAQDDGNVVSYGHVSKSDYFQKGDRVNAGDVVALSGNEGITTGPHLHLQIEDSNGNILNSENLFADCWPD